MKRLAVVAAVLAVLLGGSAAATLRPAPPSRPVPGPGRAPDLKSLLDGVLAPLVPPPGRDPAWRRRPADRRRAAAAATPTNPFAGLVTGGFAAYATGTVHHADAALSGKERGADIDVGLSDSSYSSRSLPARSDELSRPIAPVLEAGTGFGRGKAVEVRPPAELGDPIAPLEPAEATAPPSKEPVTRELTEVDLQPFVNADLLRTQAGARAVRTGCVIGSDLAFGLGSANNTRLASRQTKDRRAPLLSVSADEPPRAVSQSLSRTRLVPPPAGGSRFGLLAETRQTIFPITLFEGTEQELTIEVGGEWVLRASADGSTGSISFGPEGVPDDRPLLRLIDAKGRVIDEVSLQEIGGQEGLVLEASDLAEIIIGEDPRAVGGDADSRPVTTGTLAAAAVDVVRVRIFDQPGSTPAQVRVGHMEAGVAVPAGGIECPGIGMAKRSDPSAVRVGDRFTWEIAVANPNDCLLEKVIVTDAVTTTSGVKWKALSTSPPARTSGQTITFDGVGPIRLGESKTLRIEGQVEEGSIPGRLTNEATATGTCGPARLAGSARAETAVGPLPLLGSAQDDATSAGSGGRGGAVAGRTVEALPRVISDATATGPARRPTSVAPGSIARTGGLDGLFLALSMLGTGSVLRRLNRRRSGIGYNTR